MARFDEPKYISFGITVENHDAVAALVEAEWHRNIVDVSLCGDGPHIVLGVARLASSATMERWSPLTAVPDTVVTDEDVANLWRLDSTRELWLDDTSVAVPAVQAARPAPGQPDCHDRTQPHDSIRGSQSRSPAVSERCGVRTCLRFSL